MDVSYPVARYVYRPLSLRAAAVLARTSVTPLQVTFSAGCLAVAAAAAFAAGRFRLGAAVALVSVVADCVDGDLARLTGRTSRAGAFIDSVLDRWMDAALIFGLWASDPGRLGPVAAAALVGSLITSYARARAQSLGADCPDGIGGRDTRILLLVVAAGLGAPLVGLVLVAAAALVTSVHRTALAWRALAKLDRAASSRLPLQARASARPGSETLPPKDQAGGR